MVKKFGAGGIITLAIIFGFITAYFIWAYLRGVEEKSESNWQPVVVAIIDIKPRTTVTRDMITMTRFPQDNIAVDAITDPKQAEGMITLSKIKAKEQIRKTDLVQKGQVPSLAYEIPPGKRAIAIGASEVMAVGSTIKPGDHIDVLATYQDPVSKQETTQIILQNIVVLAVNKGQTDAASAEGANSSMTLAITPEDAELLIAADRAGVLRVALRPIQDESVVESQGTRVSEILRGKFIEPPKVGSGEGQRTPIIISPPPSRSKPTLTVIRGVQEQELPQ